MGVPPAPPLEGIVTVNGENVRVVKGLDRGYCNYGLDF